MGFFFLDAHIFLKVLCFKPWFGPTNGINVVGGCYRNLALKVSFPKSVILNIFNLIVMFIFYFLVNKGLLPKIKVYILYTWKNRKYGYILMHVH